MYVVLFLSHRYQQRSPSSRDDDVSRSLSSASVWRRLSTPAALASAGSTPRSTALRTTDGDDEHATSRRPPRRPPCPEPSTRGPPLHGRTGHGTRPCSRQPATPGRFPAAVIRTFPDSEQHEVAELVDKDQVRVRILDGSVLEFAVGEQQPAGCWVAISSRSDGGRRLLAVRTAGLQDVFATVQVGSRLTTFASQVPVCRASILKFFCVNSDCNTIQGQICSTLVLTVGALV